MTLPNGLTAPLAAPLAALTHALDEDGTDLSAVLAVLQDDLTAAVPSYLGLRVFFHLLSYPIMLSTLAPIAAGPSRATLRLPLGRMTGIEPAGEIIFYAAAVGAFAELAAEARLGAHLRSDVQLDRHFDAQGGSRRAGSATQGIDGQSELSEINLAVGVLIEQGLSPDAAAAELALRANAFQLSLQQSAQHVLQELSASEIDAEGVQG